MQELRQLFALMVASRRKYVDPSRSVEILKEAFSTGDTDFVDSQQVGGTEEVWRGGSSPTFMSMATSRKWLSARRTDVQQIKGIVLLLRDHPVFSPLKLYYKSKRRSYIKKDHTIFYKMFPSTYSKKTSGKLYKMYLGNLLYCRCDL